MMVDSTATAMAAMRTYAASRGEASRFLWVADSQWPFEEPKLEVPTIYIRPM